MLSQQDVTPMEAGVQEFWNLLKLLDSGFRRNDGRLSFSNMCERINTGLGFEVMFDH